MKDYELSVGDKIANYSPNIEGNSIDLNSFMNHALLKAKGKNNKEIVEIENLVAAYEFAQLNLLNAKKSIT
ncbi:MAG: hypothetical protein CVV22_08530 [Ignavibacteriae bacterium HGW-Ignavibacteriae-1]|nr:MAG: hypothetical protein CVV22_08530 [Ignavibacteriae bacterium HGW-Ignavibacteriae-1]